MPKDYAALDATQGAAASLKTVLDAARSARRMTGVFATHGGRAGLPPVRGLSCIRLGRRYGTCAVVARRRSSLGRLCTC